jgi:hypothetical protein
MTHIAFITLFLGLTLGPHRVAIKVTGPAHHVEVQMDGTLVAALGGEPWITTVDLGRRLVPHRLVARAMDVNGNELARAEQMVNVPRSAAEVQLVLDRDGAGVPSSVQVLWQSVESDKPREVRLTLDGKPLPLDAQLRATIPQIDVATPHILQVRAIAPRGLISETEAAFGGGLETSSGRQLTAVPIRLLAGQKTPSTDDLERWLRTGDQPARVVAVEELPGDVWIVRHPLNVESVMRLDPSRMLRPYRAVEVAEESVVHHPHPLARFIWPVPNRSRVSNPTELMPLTAGFEFKSSTQLRAILANLAYGRTGEKLHYADAVAVAGLRAMDVRRPRAVLLVLGGSVRDDSQLRPAQTREYLRSVGVPLFVWSLAGTDEIRDWGPVADIGSPSSFERAYKALNESLVSQRIVWIDGDYLPGEVSVTESGARAIEVLAAR